MIIFDAFFNNELSLFLYDTLGNRTPEITTTQVYKAYAFYSIAVIVLKFTGITINNQIMEMLVSEIYSILGLDAEVLHDHFLDPAFLPYLPKLISFIFNYALLEDDTSGIHLVTTHVPPLKFARWYIEYYMVNPFLNHSLEETHNIFKGQLRVLNLVFNTDIIDLNSLLQSLSTRRGLIVPANLLTVSLIFGLAVFLLSDHPTPELVEAVTAYYNNY